MLSKKGLLVCGAVILFVIIVALQKWNWLLYGVILLCPLMHIFMHGGHGHGGHGSQDGHLNHDHPTRTSGSTDHSGHGNGKDSNHRGCH